MTLAIRPATTSDLEFVRFSWRDSYRMSHNAGPIPMAWYDEVYGRLIGELLERPGVRVLVAFAQGEQPPHDVFGWCAVEDGVSDMVKTHENGRWTERLEPLPQPLVLYAYVKQAYREHGIARALLERAGVDPSRPWTHSFSTADVSRIRNGRRVWAGRFDPRLSRFPKTKPKEQK